MAAAPSLVIVVSRLIVLVKVWKMVTVVCETASTCTVSVVVNEPAAVDVRSFAGGRLDSITDLDIEGTMVGTLVVILV